MSLNGLFGILDYFIYLVQSTNRHGVHSPFVYHFVDRVLYGKTTCEYEAAAEMGRKRMIQSNRKLTLNKKSISLSQFSLDRIPSSKYNRLMFRWVQDQQIGGHIVEIGSSLGVTPLYLQRGPSPTVRWFIFDKNQDLLPISDYNLKKYGFNEEASLNTYTEIDGVIEQLEASNVQQIDMLIIHEALESDSFWKLADWAIPKLGDRGCIVMSTLRLSQDQLFLWKQLQNQQSITVGIDLFAMGMAFARPNQVKENFLLRY
jgi:hypothetical protein